MAFDYLSSNRPDRAAMNQPAGGPGGYNQQDFTRWYLQQYGQAPNAELLGNIGTLVGNPSGPGGQFSADQYRQAQQFSERANQPFFPEFQSPEYAPQGRYTAGQVNAGGFNAPSNFQAPAPFQYDAFQAPTPEQAQNDPGYQFSLNQGLKALQQGGAASGTARTGGAMKGLIDYAQDRGAQQYDNVYNRQAQTWGMNRSNAADAYATNYGVARDTWGMNTGLAERSYDRNRDTEWGNFDRNQAGAFNAWRANTDLGQREWENQYRGASDQFNARFRGRELQFEDLYRRWRDSLNVNTQLALAD